MAPDAAPSIEAPSPLRRSAAPLSSATTAREVIVSLLAEAWSLLVIYDRTNLVEQVTVPRMAVMLFAVCGVLFYHWWAFLRVVADEKKQ